MAIRLTKLKATNFRGFAELEIDCSNADNLIVFAGANGVGKSSLLDALVILCTRYIAQISKSKEMRHISPNDVRKGTSICSLSALLSHKDTPIALEASRGKGTTTQSSNLATALMAALGSKIESNEVDSVPIFLHYPTKRIVEETPLGYSLYVPLTPLDTYKGVLSKEQANFAAFFTWFRNAEDYENEQRRDDPNSTSPQLEAVRRAIPSLLPGYDNLRVRRKPEHQLTVTKNGVEFDIRQLSDGEKCLIAMVGDIAHRLAIANPKSENPLEGEGIVMIDEIELHLHPKWQREIVPRLQATFPNCQFILTTHSPQVIASVRPESLFLLREDGTVEQASSSYGRDSNGILEEVMGVDERPSKIKEQLGRIFDAIDAGQLEEAKEQIRDLSSIVISEPELAHADMRIRLKESLKREASKVAAY